MNRFLRAAPFAALAAALALGAGGARAQNTTTTVKPDGSVETKTVTVNVEGPRGEIYGFAQADFGYDFKQMDPNWFDVLRTTKIENVPNQYGEDGRTWASVRQSRLGVKGWIPTSLGMVKTIFEFELFGDRLGRGEDDVPSPARLGRGGPVRRRPDVEPVHGRGHLPEHDRILGPDGHAALPQHPDPLDADAGGPGALHRARAARRERRRRQRTPTASSSRASGSGRRFPDLSAHYKTSGKWGHVQLAGMLRSIKWDDVNTDQFDLSGSATGWGLHLSTVLNAAKNDVIRASVIYGEGVENYMNDAPIDIGIQNNFSDPKKPDRRQGAAGPRHRGVPRPQLGPEVLDVHRLLLRAHRQHGRPEAERLPVQPLRASRTCSIRPSPA